MSDQLNKIASNLTELKEILQKDDLDAKIKAKLKAEMDKRKFGEADATRHVIDRDRGEKAPPVPKQPKPLLQSEQDTAKEEDYQVDRESLAVNKSGQWKIEKSNYGPKGAGLYSPKDNIKRKMKNTGETVEGAGKNVNAKTYTTSGSSMAAAHEAAENKRRKANPAPVKVLKDMTPEEREKLLANYKVSENAGRGGGGM